MTTIDPNKNIQKYRTEQEMRMALNNLIIGRQKTCTPAQQDDDDIILMDIIEELLEARKKLAILESLRDALISEHAREDALRDQGGPGKVLEPMIRPLVFVETPLAALTRKAAERMAKASIAKENALQGDRLMFTGNPFTDNPSTAMQDTEKLRESVNAEEDEEEDAYFATAFTLSPEIMQDSESNKEDALYLIGLDDGCHGAENLEVLREEQKG